MRLAAPARGALLAAIDALASRGGRGAARAHLAVALAADPGSAVAHLVAARLRYVLRDYQGAMDALDRAAALGAPLAAADARARLAGRIGWSREVLAAVDAALAAGARDPAAWHALAARVYGDARAHPQALERAERALAAGALADEARCALELAAADALLAMGRTDEAARAARRASACAGGRADARREAARVLAAAGDVAGADAELRAVPEGDASHAVALAARASLCAWRGDAAGALALGDAAVRADPSRADGLRARGGARLLAGDVAGALADLDAALARDGGDAQALVLRGEARLRAGDRAGAMADLDRGAALGGGFVFAGKILRSIAVLDEPHRVVVGAGFLEEVRRGVLEVLPDAAATLDEGDPAAVRAVLRRVLDAMRGNRSATPTYARGGGDALAPLRVDESPRHAARRVLELVRVVAPEDVLRAFDDLARVHPRSPLVRCHRGELLLWQGRYADARAEFASALALDPGTRWGYIGRGAVELLEGDPERALATFAAGVRAMDGTEGPSLFVYRGEALRVLGRLDAALADLERACAAHPSRVGAWVNLALARDARGDGPGRDAVFARLAGAQCPALVADAAREAGVAPWDDDGLPDARAQRAVLERALAMLRGNRSSSCVVYATREGRLRAVPRYPHGGAMPHDHDADDVARARAWLDVR